MIYWRATVVVLSTDGRVVRRITAEQAQKVFERGLALIRTNQGNLPFKSPIVQLKVKSPKRFTIRELYLPEA